MKARQTLIIVAAALLAACQQIPDSFPPAPARGGQWNVEPQQQAAADRRFRAYAEQPELREALARLEQFMGGKRRSDSFSAEELAAASLITKADNRRKGQGGFILILGPRDIHVLEAEKTYLRLSAAKRVHLAKVVMADFLAAPAQPLSLEVKSTPGKGAWSVCRLRRVAAHYKSARVYGLLNIEALLEQAGGFFAKPARAEDLFLNDFQSELVRASLFRRMVARCMLEDVACNPALDPGTRCAAVACLRDIYLCGTHARPLEFDGTWFSCENVDALPIEGQGLELALFGKPVWIDYPDVPMSR